ncbi:hypothetical protein DL96DRAFT_1065102 [Flagelloscypha sp. PMI_526]|nr:hypothetical protein DL96DRAFT_1065102 [Flagelloscypha sp. PMI_526]
MPVLMMELPKTGLPGLADATLDNTIGAAFIGAICGACLFGVSSLQAYLYYHAWYDDTIIHRIGVGLLWVLDMLHLALTCHAVYYYAVTSFGQVGALVYIHWSIKLQIAVNVVIILLVQSLYAWRVWILSGFHKGTLKYLVILAVMGGFAIGIFLAVKVYEIDLFPQLNDLAWLVDASLGTATVIDFLLSGAMCYYLSKSKGHEGRLNSKISSLMQYILSSGLLTSACSLSALFTYVFFPSTLIFLSIESLLTKLYVGSFFAMLNARERASDNTELDSSYVTSSSVRFSRKPSRSRPSLSLKRTSSSRKFLSLASPDDHVSLSPD